MAKYSTREPGPRETLFHSHRVRLDCKFSFKKNMENTWHAGQKLTGFITCEGVKSD
jgi:hypothetical protein